MLTRCSSIEFEYKNKIGQFTIAQERHTGLGIDQSSIALSIAIASLPAISSIYHGNCVCVCVCVCELVRSLNPQQKHCVYPYYYIVL